MSPAMNLGGACSCGRGPVIGTCAFTGGRMCVPRLPDDGLPAWHHAGAAEQGAGLCRRHALAVASGEIRTAMRRIAMYRAGDVRYCGRMRPCMDPPRDGRHGAVWPIDDVYPGVCKAECALGE